MKKVQRRIIHLSVIISFGLLPAIICQLFVKEPIDRYIHIRNFRYGKDPHVIRCNRGDRLHLTFSSDDTGHSFFLEEFDIDVKVSPANEEVTVFKTSDPAVKPEITKELTLTTEFPGLLNYLVSKSNYRCHVWCGPMHAFEQGKLIIMPNTLLCFSLGSLIAIVFLWLMSVYRKTNPRFINEDEKSDMKDIFKWSGFIRKATVSRWPQILLTILALGLIYIVIMTSIFGTKMSGRNLGVLLMWTVWLFLLITFLTPLGGRIWCTICPLPFFGDLIQRGSFISPNKGRTKGYYNKFYGLFLRWPKKMDNNWLRLVIFLILATFSTTMVASPRISGFTVLMLVLVPTLMALFFELRSFCRYVCPVNAFIGPFSGMSLLALRNRSQQVCDECKAHYCQKGNAKGWACPYGLNVGEIKENADCGLCLECVRSCTYDNVTLFRRPFGTERTIRNLSDGWLSIAIFSISVIYSILYLGTWPVIRDYVNILDKQNWDLFGIYTLLLWSVILIFMPGILYLLAIAGVRLSNVNVKTSDVFLAYTGSLLPLGLLLWVAFVVPMLFVNVTFIMQSVSDPFGWGWDFFGTANIPWHQLLPQYIPWIQALLVLSGLYLSLRNIKRTWESNQLRNMQVFLLSTPLSAFITAVAVALLFFYTN
ncbi:MAG: 4Fe-4S binding protein [Cyclobacteriaceae bacterium]|nr:4Fe-4S binding protein [Cyclobacteriaceae bacterium]MCK5367446.1 4Fe-4S binding protein [Cyclobacteriaceae bacterium]